MSCSAHSSPPIYSYYTHTLTQHTLTHTHTHTHTHTPQGEEVKVDYPSWAQFIGCVIVLTSVLSMPIYLTVRLICFESSRQEALLFIHEQLRDGRKLLVLVKQVPGRTLSFVRSLRLKRQSWSRHKDQEEDGPVSYSAANGSSSPVVNTYGTQTNGPSD